MTTGGYAYPFRIACSFHGKSGYIVLDQLRTVDRNRLAKKLGTMDASSLAESLEVLQAMWPILTSVDTYT